VVSPQHHLAQHEYFQPKIQIQGQDRDSHSTDCCRRSAAAPETHLVAGAYARREAQDWFRSFLFINTTRLTTTKSCSARTVLIIKAPNLCSSRGEQAQAACGLEAVGRKSELL